MNIFSVFILPFQNKEVLLHTHKVALRVHIIIYALASKRESGENPELSGSCKLFLNRQRTHQATEIKLS